LVNTDATDMLEAAMNYELNGIPLSELVEVKRVLAPSEIIRENSERVITVRADYVGSLRSALSRVASVLTGKSVNGARIEVSGENVEFMKSLRSLVFIFMVAVLLVYMIMAAAFESLLYPFIILFEVPLSLIGVAFLLFLTRTSLNAISLIGIIVLIGIVVNDGIVLVDCINRYRRKGLNVRESVLQGASERFRPILMTSATTILGLLPLALSVNTIGSPLGIAVIGGLLSSTLLTLFIIPILYETFSRSK
ncbi:MAG TPA: efflux RND transporter permease subunit, partial [bacterium (Candidatus Stahlbacteria)]|nr:efflux RND transporter permease subunit [Candidatus Stahlbacteria bacterium]